MRTDEGAIRLGAREMPDATESDAFIAVATLPRSSPFPSGKQLASVTRIHGRTVQELKLNVITISHLRSLIYSQWTLSFLSLLLAHFQLFQHPLSHHRQQ
jgi:hypothetical protein